MTLWHYCMGHAWLERLMHILIMSCLFDSRHLFICDACSRAKHTRLPFPSRENKGSGCFELVHYHIWRTHNIIFYLLLMIFVAWIYLMKYKSKTFYFLAHFCNLVRTQFGSHVKMVCNDNGMKFC